MLCLMLLGRDSGAEGRGELRMQIVGIPPFFIDLPPTDWPFRVNLGRYFFYGYRCRRGTGLLSGRNRHSCARDDARRGSFANYLGSHTYQLHSFAPTPMLNSMP